MFVSMIVLPSTAQAYIDPGSGSFIIQMLFASIIGGLFTMKMYYQRIKTYIKVKLKIKGYVEKKHSVDSRKKNESNE
jgi:hypothetical protein